MRHLSILAFVLTVGLAATQAAGQGADPVRPTADGLMARTRQYIAVFVDRFSNVVAEEHYVQERAAQRRRRELTSDFYLVNPPGAPGWLQLRDVYEVDGKAVRDRQERLTTLLLDESAAEWSKRALAFGRESARYNLAEIGSFNLPLNALALLQPNFHDHFEFSDGAVDWKVALDARVIRFKEKGKLLFSGRPLRGRVWLDERTGAVLRTELLIGRSVFPDQITTTFTFDSDLGVWVPTGMSEWYALGPTDLTGTATYGRFRKFGVTSEESFQGRREDK